MTCPSCQAYYEDGRHFCRACGTVLERQQEQTCPPPIQEQEDETISRNAALPHEQSEAPPSGTPFRASLSCIICGASYEEGEPLCRSCGILLPVEGDRFREEKQETAPDATHSRSQPSESVPDQEGLKALLKEILAEIKRLQSFIAHIERRRGRVSEETVSSSINRYVQELRDLEKRYHEIDSSLRQSGNQAEENFTVGSADRKPRRKKPLDLTALRLSGPLHMNYFTGLKQTLRHAATAAKKTLMPITSLLKESAATGLNAFSSPLKQTLTKWVAAALALFVLGGGIWLFRDYHQIWQILTADQAIFDDRPPAKAADAPSVAHRYAVNPGNIEPQQTQSDQKNVHSGDTDARNAETSNLEPSRSGRDYLPADACGDRAVENADAVLVRAILDNVCQAHLREDINLFTSCYSKAFPEYDKKREDMVSLWSRNDFVSLTYDMPESNIGTRRALISVSWNIKVISQKTWQERDLKESFYVFLAKEDGIWKITRVERIPLRSEASRTRHGAALIRDGIVR